MDNLLYDTALRCVPSSLASLQPVLEPLAYGLGVLARAGHPLQEWLLLCAEVPLDVQLLVLLHGVGEGAGELHPGVS